MKTSIAGILLTVAICYIGGNAIAQNATTDNPADSILPVVKCVDFKLTGDGSHPAWSNAIWVELTGEKRRNSSVKTDGVTQSYPDRMYTSKFKILYSDSGIYCLYFCEDNKITATMRADFMDIYKEDVVEAFFWTDETVPVYFEYELSPLNYELPIMVPNYNGRFYGWRPWHYEGNRLTRHAVSIQTEGNNNKNVKSWTAEFFIPYTLLKPVIKTPPGRNTKWRANFYRIDYDHGQDGWTWMPVQVNFHDFKRFGTIEFR